MPSARVRFTLALIAPLLLSACSNRVVSEVPWFTAADEEGAPRLRSGLWLVGDYDLKWWLSGARHTKCEFDERKPTEQWPKCAGNFYVIRPGELLYADYIQTEEGGRIVRDYFWHAERHVLTRGMPQIAQQRCQFVGKEEAVEPAADETERQQTSSERHGRNAKPTEASHPTDPAGFCYEAVRATKFDDKGEIVAMETWPIFCGPWPTKVQVNRMKKSTVTLTPFAGLRVIYENCIAETEQSLRSAAASSEAVASIAKFGPVTHRWVRDGYH